MRSSPGRSIAPALPSCGSACGPRWRRRRRRSACSWRCRGSASGCGCRRSAAPSGLALFFLLGGRRHRAAPAAAPADPGGCVAAARPQVRPAASAGHRHRGRLAASTTDPSSLAIWRAHIERALRAATKLKAGTPAPRLAQRDPLRAARARPGAGDRDLRGRRRRAAAAHLRGLRLAGRDRAGQFPHRRLGEPADLYGQAAGDPAGPAARRADADGVQHRGAGVVGAGRQHAGHPCHRRRPSRRGGDRRPRRSEGRGAGRCQGGRAPAMPARGTEERRFTINDAGSATVRGVGPQRGDLAIHRHTGPAADHRAHQGSGGAGARQPAALLQARGRLRRRRRAGDLQAQERGWRRWPVAAALAVRGARVSAGACRRRAPATASARPPRI